MLATSLLTRGYINRSDARSPLSLGYVGNLPLPPITSQDFCAVPVRVSGSTTTFRLSEGATKVKISSDSTIIRLSEGATKVKISSDSTIIKKKCR
jgi:hypothetical protein